MVVTVKSNSGLKIGHWIEKGIPSREKRGLTQGYFFSNSKGGMIRSKDVEVDILNQIVTIKTRIS